MIAAARTREFEVTNRIADATQRPEPVSQLKPETKPDAPLTKASRVLTASVHAAVLVGIVAFVVLQLSLAATSDKRATLAKVVAAGEKSVNAPCDGVFHAAADLAKGANVQKGQLLGYIESVARQDEIHNLREKISDLRKQRLMLRSIDKNSEAYAEVSQKLRLAKVELDATISASKRQNV